MSCQRYVFSCFLILGILANISPAFSGEQEPAYNRFHITASAIGNVSNDTMSATLNSQEEGSDASVLADQVNQRINWGIEQAKKRAVKVETQSYNTQPVYYKNKITGWRVSQSISIKGKDFDVLSQLLSTLQQRLNLQQISFLVSPEKRQEAENKLIVKAIDAFKERAKIVTKALGFERYRIVELHIGRSGGSPVYRSAMPMRMEAMAADVAPPMLEAGEAQLNVSVNGEIEGY